MRFRVEISLNQDRIPKDKNRLIMSLMKHCFEKESSDYFQQLYQGGENKVKPFTFSLYLGDCLFERETIQVPDKKITLFFTTYDVENGMIFYNGFLRKQGNPYKIKGIEMTIDQIRLIKEKTIVEESVQFKTLSPIVIRDHEHNNQKTWYYSLKAGNPEGTIDSKAIDILLENLRLQLQDQFGQKAEKDIQQLELIVNQVKPVRVKNYEIDILSNICRLGIKAKPYLLDYLYKAGIGSRRAQGFGMLEII